MADTNWMDEFAVTGSSKAKEVKPSVSYGSPVPLSSDNWMDEFAITPKSDKSVTKKEEKLPTSSNSKVNNTLNNIFGPVNRVMRSLPLGLDKMEKEINPSLVKGIPVAGQFVPQTEELTKFEQESPVSSTLLRATGGIGSTLPMAAGVAGQIAPKVLPQAIGQGMLGGSLGWADTVAGNTINEERKDPDKSFILGALGGMGSSLFGRAITPNVPKEFSMHRSGQRIGGEPNLSKADIEFRAHMGDPKVERSMQMLEEALKKNIKAAPPKSAPESVDKATQALLRAGIGGAISHASGLGPIPGILIGAASPKIPQWSRQISNSWYKNQLMNRPFPKHESFPPYFASEDASQINRYVLNSLGMQMGQ